MRSPTRRTPAASALVRQIAAQAARPLQDARAMPPAAYTCPDLAGLEKSLIFGSEWLCIGHLAQLPGPGDYFTADVAGTPVIAVRNAANELRVLANSCAHRGTKLLAGAGRTARLTCPYHAWTYDLDGKLVRAPGMPKASLEGCALERVTCETWHGWIYATLAPNPEPVAGRLARLGEVVAPYDTGGMRLLFALDEEWPVNWKCLAENFMESYHVDCVHPRTIARSTPASGVTCHPGGDSFAYHTLEIRRGAAEISEFDRSLPPGLASTEIIACVFPSHLLSVTARTALSLSVQPLAVDRLRARATWVAAAGYIEAAGVGFDRLVADTRMRFEEFNAEDKAVTALLFEGLRSAAYEPGPLGPLEHPLWEFQRYLARRLTQGA